MSYSKLFAVITMGMLMTACAGQTVPDPDPVDTTYGGDQRDVNTDGMDDGNPYGGGPDEYADEGPDTVIYFDFDSSTVRGQDQETVSRHAMQLANDSYLRVRLEGHADERGSREYNIGLGERRAQAVRQMLMIQGVNAAQIQTVSFGEERPQSMGSSESDYAQNRRVEFKYTN
ncbi:MAG: peptidoglycan-associated lipoprotein Pal [Pseudomonadota bacterium]